MKLGAYIKDRATALILAIVALAAVVAVLRIMSFDINATIIVTSVIVTSYLGIGAIDYLRKRSFYQQLDEVISSLNAQSLAHLAIELIDSPSFIEGKIAFEAMSAMGRSMNDSVAASERQAQEYREFIEAWIHEIKAPIAVLRLIASGEHGENAAKVRREVDRIEAHVEQALYYARSTSLERDFIIRETDLAFVAKDAVKKNATFLIERGVAPVFEIPDKTLVFADTKWLAFIIGQLLVNAAKYGAKTIRLATTIDEESSSGKTILSLIDDGCGISPSDAPYVFDKGFVGENGRAQGSSTGMGLYLCSLMCEKMGIGITLASATECGTTMRLAFPHDRRRARLTSGTL